MGVYDGTVSSIITHYGILLCREQGNYLQIMSTLQLKIPRVIPHGFHLHRGTVHLSYTPSMSVLGNFQIFQSILTGSVNIILQ